MFCSRSDYGRASAVEKPRWRGRVCVCVDGVQGVRLAHRHTLSQLFVKALVERRRRGDGPRAELDQLVAEHVERELDQETTKMQPTKKRSAAIRRGMSKERFVKSREKGCVSRFGNQVSCGKNGWST